MKYTEQIFEAYLQVVNESAEPKFKVGDQVGIGMHYNSGHYLASDTGTVTKVNKFGHHTVEFHNRKSNDDPSKPMVRSFGADGKDRTSNYSEMSIRPVEEHNSLIKAAKDRQERHADLEELAKHIANHRLGSGHFTKLSPSAASRMKELIDKHTADKEE